MQDNVHIGIKLETQQKTDVLACNGRALKTNFYGVSTLDLIRRSHDSITNVHQYHSDNVGGAGTQNKSKKNN